MKQNKSKKIQLIIVIILLSILISIAIFSYLYFFTDVLKNNKERFFKYASQLISKENGYIDNSLQKYIEKQNTSLYENTGSIKFNISIPKQDTKLEKTNQFNISYEGKYDKANNKEENNISLNYSDDVQFPLIYKKSGDLVGIQTKYIGKNYVGININDKQENENSKTTNNDTINEQTQEVNTTNNNVANSQEGNTTDNGTSNSQEQEEQNTSIKADVSNLKQKYENMENLKLTQEELINIFNKYFLPIKNELSDEKFSKIGEDSTNGYKLSLNSDDVKNISKTILETLKTDNDLLKKLNNYLTFLNNKTTKINKSDIEKQIKDIEKMNQEAEIILYESKGKLTNINIKIGESTINLSKTNNNTEVTYNLNAQIQGKQEKNININAKYSGLDNMQNINETYEIKLETPYMIENTQEDITSQEDMALQNENEQSQNDDSLDMTQELTKKNVQAQNSETSSLTYEYIINNQIKFVDSLDIEDLNSQNTVILNEKDKDYVTNLLQAIDERLDQVNQTFLQQLNITKAQDPLENIFPIYFIRANGESSDVNQDEVQSFNSKFELYESTNSKGATVKGLLTTIQNNNEQEENNKIEEINLDGQEYEVTEQNITLMKSSVNVEDDYKIEFERDENTGLIYRAVINQK